ncbi:MAG: SRPBCC domain-containing protein [Nitrososphaerales archaeon]
MELKFQVQGKIRKPVSEVFDAVYDSRKLSAYFTNGEASGPLDEGRLIAWTFVEFPGVFPVRVKKVIKNKIIDIDWSLPGSSAVPVEFSFEPLESQSTLVRISCSGFKENQQSLDESYSHCSGWMQMLCSLKIYLEYGTNLREFFF